MTVREAGKKGGEAVKEKYGPEFYSRIGKKGGEAVAEERGREFYAEIGRKGGESVKSRRGPEFYSEIGRKGGQQRGAVVRTGPGHRGVTSGSGDQRRSTNSPVRVSIFTRSPSSM